MSEQSPTLSRRSSGTVARSQWAPHEKPAHIMSSASHLSLHCSNVRPVTTSPVARKPEHMCSPTRT
eukprot:290744-Pyramimonas_sp.AAC.1